MERKYIGVMKHLTYGVDYFVYQIPLPPHVGGAVYPESDGTYSIYVNVSRSTEEQTEALLHELMHIMKGHYDRTQQDRERSEKEDEVRAALGESAPRTA